jgi:hypothetical protein
MFDLGGTGCVFDLAKAQSQLQDQINKGLCGCTASGKGNLKGSLTRYFDFFKNQFSWAPEFSIGPF